MLEREAMQDGKSESGGLAGSRLGNAEDIAPGKRNRNGLRLNGRGRRIAGSYYRLENLRAEAKFVKSHIFPEKSGRGSVDYAP
jgi:hypothetical protein